MVGSIVSDLEVEALANVVAKLKIEVCLLTACSEICQLLHLILIDFANLQEKDKEGDEDSEEDNEEAKDVESDPDLMDDADELQMFCQLLIACSRLVFVCRLLC